MTMRWKLFRPFVSFFLLALAVVGNPLVALSADGKIHLISAENPGGLLEIKNDDVVGAYPTFFGEASNRSGVSIDYRIVPWMRAVKETEHSDNLLLFPFTRNEERENRFNWITPLKDEPICFSSVNAGVDTLEDARKLKRVLVWRGSSHESFLEKNGFGNLITVANVDKVIQILKASPDAAWFSACDQLHFLFDQESYGISAKVGTPVTNEAIWLVSGKSLVPKPELNKFVQAIDTLRKKKFLEKLLNEVAK
ncbi:MAG: hypothetical protein ISR45_10715 [Rhodospirillales bacterium]|nr:hypothetical protein [Rhodospirillales bacterium]